MWQHCLVMQQYFLQTEVPLPSDSTTPVPSEHCLWNGRPGRVLGTKVMQLQQQFF